VGTEEALGAGLRARLQAGSWICCGFGNNLDYEVQWDGALLGQFAEEAGVGAAELPGAPPACIASARDLLQAVAFHFRAGTGGEIPLAEPSLVRTLAGRFRHDCSVGGTGARAACCLARLGFPTLVHLDILSPAVLRELEPFSLATVRAGVPVRVDTRLSGPGAEAAPHLIFQFNAGDTLRLGKAEIVCPRSDRLILTADAVNRELPLAADFLSYAGRDEVRVSSLVISGFNSVSDPDVLAARLAQVAPFLERMRRKGTLVFLEDAAYHVPALRRLLLARLGPLLDFVSLNEEELLAASGLDGLPAVEECLESLQDRYGVPAVLLHTRDYSLCCGRLPDRDIELGLRIGNAAAGARAVSGRYADRPAVERMSTFPESAAGLAMCRRFTKSMQGRAVVAAPARTVSRPLCTLGLGDAFVGGFQTCL
jgi:ADP-dependent phosphofructokinase/glucokinase